jgi:hypothetical protein
MLDELCPNCARAEPTVANFSQRHTRRPERGIRLTHRPRCCSGVERARRPGARVPGMALHNLHPRFKSGRRLQS